MAGSLVGSDTKVLVFETWLESLCVGGLFSLDLSCLNLTRHPCCSVWLLLISMRSMPEYGLSNWFCLFTEPS